MPYNRDQLRAEISRDEGRKKFMYKDSVDKWTVGVGWNIEDKGLPESVIDSLLDIGIREAEDILDKLYPEWLDLSDDRQRVLLNMAFNLGQPRLAGFGKMWKAIRAGDFTEASKQMLDSKWAVQVGPRSQRLAAMMKEG